jgi:hypothetical protein
MMHYRLRDTKFKPCAKLTSFPYFQVKTLLYRPSK